MRTKRIVDEVYGSTILLVWDTTPEAFANFIRRKFDKTYDGDSDFEGLYIEYSHPKHTIVVCIPKWRRSSHGISILVHELFHATECVMDYRNINHCAETYEPWAYFLDSLVRRCLEVLP